MDWLADFWAWAWARHHNPLSWYIRPLFVLPYCYFAYRKNIAGLVLTIVGVLSSMFWFPAPSETDARAAEFLAMEQRYVMGEWTLAKIAMTLMVPIWFVLLGGAFWRRSWVVGIAVVNIGVALKVVWSFYFGGDSAWSIVAPAVAGAIVCNAALMWAQPRKSSHLRWLLACGVLSPALYGLADLLAGLSWDAYSFRDQTISELGAIGAPSRPLFSALLIPVYVLFLAFGVGVWRAASGRRGVKIAAGFLIGFGLLALTVGQFVPMEMRGTEQGMRGALHLLEGGVASALLLAGMIAAATSMGDTFRTYTAVTIVLMLAFAVWSGLDAPGIEAGLDTPWIGVKERIFWYSYQLWFIVLALVLLRESRERT